MRRISGGSGLLPPLLCMLNCKNKFSTTDTNLPCVFFVAYVALLMRQPPCLVARPGTMANEIFHVRFSFVQGFCVPYCIVKKNKQLFHVWLLG